MAVWRIMGELMPCEGVTKASASTKEEIGIAARSREAMNFMVILANLSERKCLGEMTRASNHSNDNA